MGKNTPYLSIIIVSWNAKKYLELCIRSILDNLAGYDAEIIVVDNASSDGSPELVKEYFPDVRLICNDDNLGFAKANNIGIKQSRGDYILLINSDVEVYPDCIIMLVDYIEKHPEIGMLGPQILGSDRKVQRSCMGNMTLWDAFCRSLALDTLFSGTKLFGGYMMTYWKHDTIREVDVINGCFWVVRRESLRQVGLLDERFFIYGEDRDWCKRFWDAGWKIVYYPEAQAIHYGGASSANAPIRFYIEMQRADMQYWEKYHNRLSQIIYSLMILLHSILRIIGQTVMYILKPSSRHHLRFKVKRAYSVIKWQLSSSK